MASMNKNTALTESQEVTEVGEVRDVLLVGYGAVGVIFAHVLSRSGRARVSVVARSNYEICKEEGMYIRSAKYGVHKGWRPYRLLSSVAEGLDRAYAYVLVTTKCLPELYPNSELLAPFFAQPYVATFDPPIFVLLQNGLGIGRDLWGAIVAAGLQKRAKIVSSSLFIGTNLLDPNTVEHNDFDRTSIGIYKPLSPEDTYDRKEYEPGDIETLNDLATLFRAGGNTVNVVPEIQSAKFGKNLWNLVFSSIATLTAHPVRAVFQDPKIAEEVIPTIRAIFSEAIAVGRAMGFDETALPEKRSEEILQGTKAIHEKSDSWHRASMLLDLENGRPLEVEVIVGEVVRYARKHGVDVPRIETLYALLTVVQGQLVAKTRSKAEH